jgi:hypothetical protein
MTVEELVDLVEKTLDPLGSRAEEGEVYRSPELAVLAYFARRVRLSRVPVLGRALGVCAVVTQPPDVGTGVEGYRALLARVARAAGTRFSPLRGLSIGLNVVIVSPDPIEPDGDRDLQSALENLPRFRTVPLGAFRVNLDQQALSLAIVRGPEGLFPEPETLAEALTPEFRRYVPLIEG